MVPVCHGEGSSPAFPKGEREGGWRGLADVFPDPIPTVAFHMGHSSEQGCPQPTAIPFHRGKMEKEKERARLAGVIQAEPAAAEVAEDTQKERRLFQLHMCEVRAVPGGSGTVPPQELSPRGTWGTALLQAV